MSGTPLAASTAAALIDARTGVVRRVERRPVPDHLPRSFTMIRSLISDSTRFSPWASDTAGAGYAFGDEATALAAAVGEAVERYCANLPRPGLPVLRYSDHVRAGRRAVDPAGLALFSADQHARPGFPFAPLSGDVATEWVTGADLLDRDPVEVPAAVVWPGHHRMTGGPPRTPVLQAGLAAGVTRADAERSALAEVIERDAMTLSWTGRAGVRPVRAPPRVVQLATGPQGRLRARSLAFCSPFGLPVRGVLLHDPVTARVCLGTGARPDPDDALLKALGEAFQLLLLLGEYDDPHGPFATAAEHPNSPLALWRADRAYLAGRRTDLQDVVDYGVHLQLALDPAYQERFEAELAAAFEESAAGGADLSGTGPAVGSCGHDELLARLVAAGHRPVSVDVTTPDVAAAGLHVVRVVVPGLYGNAAAGLPFLGGTRLAASLGGRGPRTFPLPH